MFQKQKKIQLSRKDSSKKGSVDNKIKTLVNKINKNKDYYTTSSCSGRILLLTENRIKKDVKWLLVSHNAVALKNIKDALKKTKKTIWFKFEPMIMHVVCSSLDSAQNLVDKARYAGFKKSGIMATKKRIIVEIRGTDFISAPLGKADDDYLKLLIKEANKKMKINDEKIKKFKQQISC